MLLKGTVKVRPSKKKIVLNGVIRLTELELEKSEWFKFSSVSACINFSKFCSFQFTIYKYLWRSWCIFKGTL